MPYTSSVTTMFFQKKEEPLNRFGENFKQSELPKDCVKLIIDARNNQRFVNFFLNSDINLTVEIIPTETDWVNYAGFFSGCKNLNSKPIWDNSKNKSMAAMFKSCENIRFSLYNVDTSNTLDFRQCFWGANGFSGNGLQSWDFSSAKSPDAMRNFMGGGAFMWQKHYDEFLLNLHRQMKSKTLPTPMYAVNMGNSKYSPKYHHIRQEIIDYGWEILDGGLAQEEIDPSVYEEEFYSGVLKRIKQNPANWLDGVDMSCHTRSSQGGILISPRHMLYTYHYRPSIGKKVVFWNGQESIVENVDTQPIKSKWGDLTLVRLKYSVNDVNPVLFLNKDWRKQCPQLGTYGPPSPFFYMKNIPTIWTDRSNRVCISAVNFITEWPSKPNQCIMTMPDEPLFKSKYKNAIGGDSGSPHCFLYKDRFVLSHLVTTAGPGNGSWVNLPQFRDYIENQLALYGEKLDILE